MTQTPSPLVIAHSLKLASAAASRMSKPNDRLPASEYFGDFAQYLAQSLTTDDFQIRSASLEAAVDDCALRHERGRSMDRSSSNIISEARSLYGMASSYVASIQPNNLSDRVAHRRQEGDGVALDLPHAPRPR